MNRRNFLSLRMKKRMETFLMWTLAIAAWGIGAMFVLFVLMLIANCGPHSGCHL